jgi:hypothetical protein
VIFSDEFKFTYKTVSFSQTKHVAVAPFPMMLLNLLLCVSNPSALLDNGLRQRMLRKVQFRQYRQAVFGSWFRLGENIETIGVP